MTGRETTLARARQRTWAHWGGVWLPGSQGERADARGWAVGWAGSCRGGGGLPLGSRALFLPVASTGPWGPGTLHPRPGRDTHVLVCAELRLRCAAHTVGPDTQGTSPLSDSHSSSDLSMSHPSGPPVSLLSEGPWRLSVLPLGEATRRKSTDSSPEGIPGQRTSWPGC